MLAYDNLKLAFRSVKRASQRANPQSYQLQYVYEIGCYWHKGNMISPNLLEIERSIGTLSLEEQEWLLERIKRQVQEKKLTAYKFIDKKYTNEQLAAMTKDLDIQTEIAENNKEFPVTEIDGLEKV
ncbi:hypothetical protein OGM63_13375 [Plectonema radiosum NIES-515]|uniref:Uncharacterized protein n=1 Tax=Plectonema radiosum NIES-515 TaxID=2986073 RepID=A0ABT3AZE6_9CYAN|nr:hypothetical protein [Plectonema radiosum]MCV3214492.1 hypothetical protein [Plectonema radiosum NIES-515]